MIYATLCGITPKTVQRRICNMLNFLQNRINKMVDDGRFKDDSELYLYLLLIIATFFSGVMHALLIIVMTIVGISLLAIVNMVSVCIYSLIMVMLIKHRCYKLTGIAIAVEVILYALFVSIWIGANEYTILYYFVLLFMQPIIPYASGKVRLAVAVAIWLALLVSVLIGIYVQPFHPLQDSRHITGMILFNVNLTFIGVALELSVGVFVQNVIARCNITRMDEYKSQANTDSLTGLKNRRYSEEFITKISSGNIDNNWCVAMLDVDNFKQINDTMGHPVGDEVLRKLSETLRTHLRKTDVIFRWGGEEFLIFLSGVDLEVAAKILDKVRKYMEETAIESGGNDVGFTVTVGVARVDVKDVQKSIGLCDERMYFGKQIGKNKVVFYD